MSRFVLSADEAAEPEIARRLNAPKALYLRDGELQDIVSLALAHADTRRRVLVYVWRPKDAETIARAIIQKVGPERVAILTGTIRGHERDERVVRRPPMHTFALVDEDGNYCRFDPTEALVLAAELRHATHLRAKQLKFDAAFIEGYVCGHANHAYGKDDRFAYVPVPTLAPAGRDNAIRRVLLLEGRQDRRAKSLARRLTGVSLSGKARLRSIGGNGDDRADSRTGYRIRDGVLKRYMDAAGRWATVTPIVLPGHLSGRGLARRRSKLVLKSLVHAGIMTPVAEIRLQPDPVFPGAERAERYRVPEYLGRFTRTHAIITFAEPIAGPIVIGAGRYVGLGLLAALDKTP
jgi:CRISPR-associated protein Csb2